MFMLDFYISWNMLAIASFCNMQYIWTTRKVPLNISNPFSLVFLVNSKLLEPQLVTPTTTHWIHRDWLVVCFSSNSLLHVSTNSLHNLYIVCKANKKLVCLEKKEKGKNYQYIFFQTHSVITSILFLPIEI